METEHGKILIVDDEESAREVLRAHLEPEGYEVMAAVSGKEALEAVARFVPDLILLDILMPDINGIEVCRRLRAEEKTKNTPIVMVTAFHEKKERIEALEAGADEFLSKPVDKTELLARVRSLLRVKAFGDHLAAVNAKLKELQQLKDDLSGMITHDINNFLTIVSGNLELMVLEKEVLPLGLQEDLTAAQEATGDLVTLVSDFMDIARLEDNKLTLRLETIDIAALIKQVAERAAVITKKAGIELVWRGASDAVAGGGTPAAPVRPDELKWSVDKNLLRRVLMNLIINAVKFTPAGGRVEIEAEKDGEDLKISVRDTGAGIPPSSQSKIFEKFAQLEVKQVNLKRGRGIGLTFCKLAVEAHGGKIWVTSEGEGRGSTFFIALPKKR